MCDSPADTARRLPVMDQLTLQHGALKSCISFDVHCALDLATCVWMQTVPSSAHEATVLQGSPALGAQDTERTQSLCPDMGVPSCSQALSPLFFPKLDEVVASSSHKAHWSDTLVLISKMIPRCPSNGVATHCTDLDNVSLPTMIPVIAVHWNASIWWCSCNM